MKSGIAGVALVGRGLVHRELDEGVFGHIVEDHPLRIALLDAMAAAEVA